MDAGLIGGLLGSLIGVAGALFGTFCSIKNTNGPLERAFVVRMAVVGWLVMSALVGIILLVPKATLWMWIPLAFLLTYGIRYMNGRQLAIRREEQGQV